MALNRQTRANLGQQTLNIINAGEYMNAVGTNVSISQQVQECVSKTKCFPADFDFAQLLAQSQTGATTGKATTVHVANQTTLEVCSAMVAQGKKVLALNFASAKNPGGGFLGGASAQEESLARSSALYNSLTAPQCNLYYQTNRQLSPPFNALYTDATILTPDCPVFRADDGSLLNEPWPVSFITCPAPNVGAIAQRNGNSPEVEAMVHDTIRRRLQNIFTIASAFGYQHLVLGAWGCGVFRNDPHVVAQAFRDYLVGGQFKSAFTEVVFAVVGDENLGPFKAAFTNFPDNPSPTGTGQTTPIALGGLAIDI